MLTIILAESALETAPRSIWKHPSIRKHAKRRGKKPWEILLDRSYHHATMLNLKGSGKRGRPDIVHLSLLEALGSPLNREGLLRTYVHTINDFVIDVNPNTRLPRNYNQFIGLFEQLFKMARVPEKGAKLLELRRLTLPKLVDEIGPDYVVAFTRIGKPKTLGEVAEILVEKENPAVIVGAFPHGHYAKSTSRLANELVSIDREMLEAWTVVSRVIFSYENAINLPEKRLRRT